MTETMVDHHLVVALEIEEALLEHHFQDKGFRAMVVEIRLCQTLISEEMSGVNINLSNSKRTSMSKTNVSENVILPSFVLTERSTKLLCTPTHECSLRNCLIPSSNSMRLTFLRRSAENLTDLDSKLHLRFRLKDGPLL